MNEQDTLIQLLKITERLSAQVDSMDVRLSKIESVVNNDIRQDQRLSVIESSLARGSSKFTSIENRLRVLEEAEGKKAKAVVTEVIKYVGTTIMGFILAAIVFYIKAQI